MRTRRPTPAPPSSPACRSPTATSSARIAYDQAAFDAGIDADRGQWTRASAQGALGLGLPAYGGIGTVAPVDAGLDDVACPAVPAPPVVPSVHASVGVGRRRRLGDPHRGGLPPGETVDVTLHSTPISLGSATADADGGVVKTVTIPADVEPGVHSIEMVGQTSGVEVAVEVEVLPADGAAAGGLPATGSASGELTVAACRPDRARSRAGGRRRVAGASRSGSTDGRSDPARGARSPGWARRAGSAGRVGRCRPGRGSRRRARGRAPTEPASPSSSTASAFGDGVQVRCAPQPVRSAASTRSTRAASPSAARPQFPGLLCRIDGEPADRTRATGAAGQRVLGLLARAARRVVDLQHLGRRQPRPAAGQRRGLGVRRRGPSPGSTRRTRPPTTTTRPPTDDHRRRAVAPAVAPTAGPTADRRRRRMRPRRPTAPAVEPTTSTTEGRPTRPPPRRDAGASGSEDDDGRLAGGRRRASGPADDGPPAAARPPARSSGLVAAAALGDRGHPRRRRRRRAEEELGLMARGCRARCTRARGGCGRSGWRPRPAARPTRSCCC